MENRDKLTICFLWGGQSSENQVSRNSAVSILREIDRDKYNIVCVGITSRGGWLVTDADTDEIADGSWDNSKRPCIVPSSPFLPCRTGHIKSTFIFFPSSDIRPSDDEAGGRTTFLLSFLFSQLPSAISSVSASV